MREDLRKRVVAWATNYTEMDCNRVRDAKPLMDDLLRHIKEQELVNNRLRESWREDVGSREERIEILERLAGTALGHLECTTGDHRKDAIRVLREAVRLRTALLPVQGGQ